MPLAAGTRLGSYEVLSALGAGGMGEVYRARDTRLNRDVAVKVLPDLFAADPDRLARFEREAHMLAALNHPNIAQVYGIEESSGVRAIVMELVEGRTLDAAIPSLSAAEIRTVALQIAEALEAAHEQGIIHRDLKPANVSLREDGTVKVLDFGLAKALDQTPSGPADAMNSPTLTVRGTQMGIVVGTAAYMAPEQARGRAADRRADIWAFGAVLFEMLAGTRAFDGESVSDTIAAVLTREPEWSRVRRDAPRFLVDLARRCLRKDPRRRPQSMGDVRIAVDEGEEGTRPAEDRAPAGQRSTYRRVSAIIVLAATGAALGWTAGRWMTPGAAETPRVLPMQLAVDVALALEDAPAFALAPDGATLAFVGGSGLDRQLYVRTLDSAVPAPVPGTSGASSPFFSPDGQWLGFVADEALKKVRIAGDQPPVRLASATDRGGAWLADGTVVYSQGRLGPLFRVAASGGTPEALTRAEEAISDSHRFPTAIPGRDAVLFTARSATGPEVLGYDLRTGDQTTVLTNAYHAVYSAPDVLLFVRGDTLFGVRFDVERLQVSGSEWRIADGLRARPDVMAAQYAVAGPMLLFHPGDAGASDRAQIVFRDMAGHERPLLDVPDTYRDPQYSPDGTRLAYSVLPPGVGTDLWVLDQARGLKTRLTFESSPEWWPVWTPDGQSIAFALQGGGIGLMRADGSGELRMLTENRQRWQIPMSFSPDGTHLAYHELHRETSGDIWILPLGTSGPPLQFLATPFYEGLPVFSPDGRWIAYASNESGSFQLYVRPFPGPGPRHQVSGDRTLDVHYWSADGRRLFYRSGNGRMMAVPVRIDRAGFAFDQPAPLFDLDPDEYPDLQFWRSFALAPDGSGFALVKVPRPLPGTRSYLMLMLGWRR